MTARERILALRLLEKQQRDPVYFRRLGICVRVQPGGREGRGKKTGS